MYKISNIKRSAELIGNKNESKIKLRNNIFKSFSISSEYESGFPREYKEIINALAQIFYFDREDLLMIISNMNMCSVDKNEILFITCNINKIYIVKSGSVELSYSDKNYKNLPLCVIGAGDPICTSTFFLEQIISKNPNTSAYRLSATALETSIICTISFDVFKKIFCNDFNALIRLIQLSIFRLKHVMLRTLCLSFGLRLDLLMHECNYANLPIPENINYDLEKLPSDDVITFNSTNIYNSKPVFQITQTTNDIFRDLCILEILNLLKININSNIGENIKKLLISEGICLEFKNGDVINDDCSLYYLFKGSIISELIIDKSITENNHKLNLNTGQFFGLISILSGTKTNFNFLVTEETQIFMIPNNLFRKISYQNPYIIQILTLNFLENISIFMKNLNFSLELRSYEAGDQIYLKGSNAENLYVVQHGRLQLMSLNEFGEEIILAEYSKNDFIGMDEAFEKKRRIGTLTAVRPSVLISFQTSIFNFIQRFSPEVMIKITNLLYKKISSLNCKIYKTSPEISSYSTVALVPASKNIPIMNFSIELNSALNKIVPSTVVDSYNFSSQTHPMMSRFWYLEIINQIESENYITLWVCDYEFTQWTQQSIIHSDLILVVAFDEEDFVPNSLENQINKMLNLRTPQHLVLLHREDRFKLPECTALWLSCRSWISDYHHIRCSKKIFKNKKSYLDYFYSKTYIPQELTSDYSRLARRITHTAMGLVLGGGGARGLSQVGVINALVEAGIPIDMIGGCSIGAFNGALYSYKADTTFLTRRASRVSERAASIIRHIFDLTLPLVSFFSGSKMNSDLFSVFNNIKIEDFLIPYFCVSTDISNFQLKIHSFGMVWRACRASMSLLNIVPPICDSYNNLLIDGAYLNVLPFDVMLRKGAKYVIAVDVSRKSSELLGDYGDELSGWRVLWNKINPFGKKLSIPSISEINENLCFINSMKLLSDCKNTPNVLFLSPPIEKYYPLDFKHYKELMEIGYDYTKEKLKELYYDKMKDYRILFNNRQLESKFLQKIHNKYNEIYISNINEKNNKNFKYHKRVLSFPCIKQEFINRKEVESD